MSETSTAQHDPAAAHSDLLQGLTPPQRDAVVAGIRHSAASGWPASRASVSSLVAYAMGRITSREYAVQILVALGFADAQTAAALVELRTRRPEPQPAARPTSHYDAATGFDFLFGR